MTSPVRALALLLLLFHFFSSSAHTEETPNPLAWQAHYQQAAELEKAGKYADAITKFDQSLKIAEESGDNAGIAKSLIGIGGIRTRLGEYAEAMRLIQQAKETAERANDRLILVLALVGISELDERQSRFAEALKSAHQALEIAQELQDSQTLSIAYRSVGHSYYSQGQFNIALDNYRESLKYAEETKNPAEICRSLLAVGVAVLDTGDLVDGTQYLLSALETAEKAGERWMITGILSEIGIAYKEMGMYEESAEYYIRGLRATEEIGNKEGLARILNNLGVLNANEGRNNEAIQYYHQALEIAEELNNQRGVALLLTNIGNIFRYEGRLEEALSYYERSLKKRETIGDQWGIASALMNMGLTFEQQNHYDKAIDVYQRSLKISEQIGNKSRVALTLDHLGEAFLSKGNYQLAEESYKKALSLAREIHSKIIIADSLEGFGKVKLELQEYAEAEEYFRQALGLSKEVTQPEMIWRTSYGLAKAYEKQERYSQALDFYSEAINEIEKVRARASSDEGKSNFLAKHFSIYEDLISMLYKLNQKFPKKGYDIQAFEYSERAKARMFLDTLAEFQSGIRKGLNSSQVRQERAILRKISKLQSELWEASSNDIQERKKKLQEAEMDLDHFILKLKLENPQYAQLKYPEPYGLSHIRKQLHGKAVLLEFFVGEKESFVFAVTSTDHQVGALPGRSQLEDSVRKYLDRIRTPPTASLGRDANSLQQSYRQQARILFQLLMAPVRDMLKGKEDLILIQDGILLYVPFETLIIDENSLLMERFRIKYAPSATIWASLLRKPMQRSSKEFIAFADPVFSINPSVSSEELQNTQLRDLVRLQFTREEVKGIASLYPKNSQDVYLAEEATEENFNNQKISQYKVVHFAAHALINEDFPRRSGIVLSSGSNKKSDGLLQMYEIWNLDLNAELVVLSACETGLGKVIRGEGMVSLMRAFFYAGTKNIVVSLWKVDDKSTADLMKAFYVQVKNGKSYSESLRQAKLDMMDDARNGSTYAAYADPYYWGPFILIGPGE